MSRQRGLVIGVLVVTGAVMIGIGWAIQGRELVPGFLLQIGAGLVLIGILLVIEFRLERGIRDLKRSVAEQGATLASLRSISRELVAEQYESVAEQLKAWETSVTHQSVWSLLNWSQSTGTVSPDGVRVYLPGPSHDRWMRLHAEGTEDHPRVSFAVETADRTTEARYEWHSGRSTKDAVHDLFTTIRSTAVEWTAFDASWIFQRALVPIRVGLEAHFRLPRRNWDIGPVVEVPDTQWAITDLGLECTTRHYPIHWWRLWEMDWAEHVSRKGWVKIDDFLTALLHARGYFAARRNEANAARTNYEPGEIA